METPEQLSGAVFERETRTAMEDCGRPARRPRTCLLHNFACCYFLAIVDRLFLRGFLLADAHLLGRLADDADRAARRHGVGIAHDYLALLAEYRLIRDELSIDELGYAYQAMFEGFLRAAGGAPDDGREQRADLFARTGPGTRSAPTRWWRAAVLREVVDAVAALLTRLIAADGGSRE